MKKLLRISCLLFVCIFILGLSACGLFDNDLKEKKIYDVSNQYFSKATFEKHKLTSIGANGHQGSGTSYEVEIKSKCHVSLIEYTANVKLYSADNTLLETFDKSLEKEFSAKSEISFTNKITYDTYKSLDIIVVSWRGKSYENPAEADNNALIPIKYIDLTNRNTTMLVGESIALQYILTPENTDDDVIISCGNSSIIELDGNKVTAKNSGDTWILIKAASKNSSASREIRIRVIESLDYDNFTTKYKNSLKTATVSVFCKRYNTNWLGQEKNTHIVSGKGTIVKSAAYANYFLTDKTIFDSVSTKYDHEEWYITDYSNKKYSIAGIQYHKTANIALGSFTSSTAYSVAPVCETYPYEGDYAISLIGNPLTCRISETDYLSLTSSSLASATSYVFYHEAGLTAQNRGEAIYNTKGEIIGMNLRFLSNKAIAVSSIEIRELINAIFNPQPSVGGGPIDII